MSQELVVRISARTVLTVLGLVLTVLLLTALTHVAIIFFMAVLLAVAITGPVNWLEDRGVRRSLSIGLIYLLLTAAFTALGFVLIPMVVHQVQLLARQLPVLVREPLRQGSAWLGSRVPSLRDSLPTGDVASEIANKGVSLISGVGNFALELGLRISSIVVALIVILVMAFFLTSRRGLASRAVYLFAPLAYQERLQRTVGVIGRRLSRWVWAQVMIAAFYAVTFGMGLAFLGVPYAVALAVLGGILELVPYVGGFIATILTMIVAFTVNPLLAVWVLILHIIVGNIEVHLLAPRLMGHAVETHPIITILALFSGAELLGIPGALIAIPFAVVVQAIVEEFYLRPRGRQIGVQPEPAASASPAGPQQAAKAVPPRRRRAARRISPRRRTHRAASVPPQQGQ